MPTWGETDGDSKSIYVPGNRSTPDQRRLVGWPLEPVELDLPVTEEDFAPGMQWPPARMNYRTERLNQYERIYRGDLRDFVYDTSAVSVAINYPGLICDETSSMLSATMPEDAVSDYVSDGGVEIMRFGRTYIIVLDGYAKAYDPRLCFRDMDGERLWVFTPYVTEASRDGSYNAVMIYEVAQGEAIAYEAPLQQQLRKGAVESLRFGERVETGRTTGGWSYADRPPTMGGWGASALDAIIPVTFEIAKRYTSNAWVLDAHQFPTRIMAGSVADMARQILRDFEHDGPGWDNADTQRAVEDSMGSLDTFWTGDGVDAASSKYMEWSGQLAASFAQIDSLRGELRFLVSMSAALEQEGGDTPSGTALAQMDSRSLRRGTQLWVTMYEAATTALGYAPQWDNPFEIPEPALEEPDDNPTQAA